MKGTLGTVCVVVYGRIGGRCVAVRRTWPFARAAYLFIDQKKGFGDALWIDTAQWKPGSNTAECVGSLS